MGFHPQRTHGNGPRYLITDLGQFDFIEIETDQGEREYRMRLTSYHPDEMVYSYNAKTDQLALFSEVYYPPAKGWELYIDGQPAADFTKANFILRFFFLLRKLIERESVF